MKNIIYVIFFSLLSSMLIACSDERKVSNDNEKIEKTEKIVTTSETVKTVETKDNETEKTAAITHDNERFILGEKLIKEHCSSCHQAEMYTRAESKIKSPDALLKQIKMCDSNIGTALFDEDMEAIAAYLDRDFYKFAK